MLKIKKALIRIAIFSVLLLLGYPARSQYTPMGRNILKMVNEARTDPQKFLKKNRDKIQTYQPKFIVLLEKAEPIERIAWDTALEFMCHQAVVEKELDPLYPGKNKMCGTSSGRNMGDISDDPLKYVCDFYTNVLDEDNIYLGVYYQSDGFSFRFGKTCIIKKVAYVFNDKIDSSMVDFASINTAKNENYMSEREKRMILEINFVRGYPKVYAQIIQQYLAKESSGPYGLSKNEYEAGIELIKELNSMEPLRILKPKECIYRAAQLHAEDCRKRGFIDHNGSDGSMPWDRIKNSCKNITTGNENLASNVSLREAVICLLIDAGISDRGHRYNMLDPGWKFVGCAIYDGETNKWYTMKHYVQNFAY